MSDPLVYALLEQKYGKDGADEITALRQQLEQAQARVVELEKCIDDGSDAWLLRKQAEAITKASNEAHNKLFEQAMLSRDSGEAISAFMDYAQRLRQQAADLEAKTAGGSDANS